MNLVEIKKALGVETLPLTRVIDENKQPTEWLAHWNNDNRVRTVIHQDLLETIQEEQMLFLKTSDETAQESGKAYTLHIICRSSATPEVVL